MEKSFIVGETNMKKLRFQTPTRLNDDIISEIINRLPAILNFRFKCVSKQWFFLNTEALKRKSQTLTMSGVFYITPSSTKSILSVKYARTQKGPRNEDSSIDDTLSFLPKHLNMRIYGSCNGLLLCEGWDGNNAFVYSFDQTSCLYVCNPATRKWVKIPNNYAKDFLVIILDFNPLVSVHFNVITIRLGSGSHQYTFEIFSSNIEEWKVNQVTNPILREYIVYDHGTSIFRGLIFCLNRKYTDVMGFDMEGNCCRKIELPGQSHQKDRRFNSFLGPSAGSLCQSGGSLHYYYTSGRELYVWKLVDYESGSWSLKGNFSVTGPLRNIQHLRFHLQMDEILFSLENKIHSYNMQTTQMIELCPFPYPFPFFPYSPCYLEGFGNHVESK